MERYFVEVPGFERAVDQFEARHELLKFIQKEILKDPQKGAIVPGCGGVRKLRIPSPGRQKGKRGGFRVLYLDLPEKAKTYLLVIYGKDEADNISPEGKKLIKNLVSSLKKEAKDDNAK